MKKTILAPSCLFILSSFLCAMEEKETIQKKEDHKKEQPNVLLTQDASKSKESNESNKPPSNHLVVTIAYMGRYGWCGNINSMIEKMQKK